MRPAAVAARLAAFWLDLLVVVTMLAVVFRTVWSLAPGSEVRESAMQLFTPKQFLVFWINAAATVLLISLYHVLAPALTGGSTPGQRLAGIRRVRLDGSPLAAGQQASLALVSACKLLFVFFGGPLAAAAGGNVALSLVFLLAPALALLLLSALSWTSPEGVGPQERALGYRYLARE